MNIDYIAIGEEMLDYLENSIDSYAQQHIEDFF